MEDIKLVLKKLNKARQEFIKEKVPQDTIITFLTPRKVVEEVVKPKYKQITLEDGIKEAEQA